VNHHRSRHPLFRSRRLNPARAYQYNSHLDLQRLKMQTPPFRTRPKLHLTLTQSTGSPGNASQPAQPSGIIPMPSNTTAYSPFRSAGLKPPTPYGGPTQFTPRSSRKFRDCRHNLCFCGRRVLNSKIFWLALLLGALALWWTGGGADQLDIVKLSASELGRELFPEVRTRDLQFFPATSPKIHVLLILNCVLVSRLMMKSMLVAGQRLRTGFAEMVPFQVSCLQQTES
jgi:hypothetical protein